MTILRLGPAALAWCEVDGDRRATSRALLNEVLEALGAADATVVTRCDHCGSSDHGRPRTADGAHVVSVAYAADLAVVAAAPASTVRAIGVDAEAGPDRQMPDLAGLFAPRHPPTLREWTRIEATLKADGRGLRVEPREVRLDGMTATVPDGPIVELFDVEAIENVVVSLAIDRGGRSTP
ncbi:hypothetical protein [Microbacterium dauci]|uniref:4'-phosphopantetheinyl transferase n=1 Tax=Microbacterium dauci TaxID=3048008 RepID=A0ABT6ZFF4_9MICO|nr:hypothetical protein [Microbacterium sp. LX3-4]MDJ1114891.1 hypothetical protein [Microbacterium sp. LX3-4]